MAHKNSIIKSHCQSYWLAISTSKPATQRHTIIPTNPQTFGSSYKHANDSAFCETDSITNQVTYHSSKPIANTKSNPASDFGTDPKLSVSSSVDSTSHRKLQYRRNDHH